MNQVTIHAGDNRESLRRLIDSGVRVHSIVTDPPYGLVSVTKRFGKEGSAPARANGNDGSFGRLSGGFMGKLWDGSGIERDPEFWALLYEILLPGGYVFAFSGSRTGHWQACAMEMAGFIMHPMHGWVFGTGFPKAHNASKAIDRTMGITREVVGQQKAPGFAKSNVEHGQQGRETWDFPVYDDKPVTPEAARWEGWAYGTQAQKPALEPIYLGQKPFSEKTGAANMLKHGVGAINVNGCRVPSTDNLNGGAYAIKPTERENLWGEEAGNAWRRGGAGEFVQPEGRYPSNLILDGSPEVVSMFPAGKSGKPGTRRAVAESLSMSGDLGLNGRVEVGYADEGSTARFFHHFPIEELCEDEGCDHHGTDHVCRTRPDMDPLFYSAKAGKEDRAGSKHPTVKPIALMQYLVRHITPPGGIVLDPFAGSGTTAVAAGREGFDCILMEAEDEYLSFLMERFGQSDVTPDGLDYLKALGFGVN